MAQHKTAILIKTSSNRLSLWWCIVSVREHFRDRKHRIYLSDEHPLADWKIELYRELSAEGHHVEIAQEKQGVSYARNRLLDALSDESQVLRLDDDFELGGEFSLDALEEILWSDERIAFCSDAERQIGDGKGVKSGTLRPLGGSIHTEKGVIVKKFHGIFKKWKKVNGVRYRRANFTRNLLLLKRNVIESIRWNDNILFQGEHVDLMFSIKEKGLLGAYTPDSVHLHRDDLRKFSKLVEPIDNCWGSEEMAAEFARRWGCHSTKATYGISWYIYEAIRRAVC